MERVLIVDDDPDILRLVTHNISQAGFQTLTATTGRTAIEAVQKQAPDLIILDVMLPDIDGMEVCRLIRQQEKTRKIPIIMLTAKGDEIDRVVGFEVGADDYVPKPFSPRELVLRVKSILRRSRDGHAEILRLGHVMIYPQQRRCLVNGVSVSLTAKEFDLLFELIRAKGNVLTRDVLMDRIWGYHGEANSRTLDTHVRRLREKLGPEGACVETVRGVGYRASDPSETPAR